MSTISIDKPVNLYQLGLELGGNVGFCRDGDQLTADGVGVDRLTAAVSAHVADPSIVWVDPNPDSAPAPVDPPPKIVVPAGAVADLQTALDEHPPTLTGMHTALATFAAALTTET